ncbi:MAG: ABC transporter substrate-binding protein [Patescibacteria group bacterium]
MSSSWRRFKPKQFILPKNARDLLSFLGRYLPHILIFLVVFGLIFFGYRYYIDHTASAPQTGGTFIEGMAGQPGMINPILSQTNDVDRDLCQLIFSGLLTYNQDHNLIGDLADHWDISEDEKVYTVYLKDNLKWHDGEPLTSDDVVLTFHLIQNEQYPGTLANNWQDVRVEKIDDQTIQFSLNEVFSPFLVNLTTGILPAHIFANADPAKIDTMDFNSQPIGSGPYKISKIKIDKKGVYSSIELESFPDYYGQAPYIPKIIIKFYDDYQTLYSAYRQKEVLSIAHVLTADWPMADGMLTNVSYYDIALPQYTAIFINQDANTTLRDPYIKEALYYGLDRERILEEAVYNKGKVIDTPILEGFMGYNPDIAHINRDVEKAKAVLEQGKWTDVDGDGVREKDNVRLKINLITSDNPEFVLASRIIQTNWQEIGIQVEVGVFTIGELESQYIKPRQYDALLFGENLGADPDPYVYWHSSQINDPGLNLSNYTNVEVDRYLENGRQTNDIESRIHNYLPFQEVITDEKPAIFLYRPYYIYAVNPSVQGINVDHASNPAERFLFISDWYINTQRVWKTA